MKPLHELAEVIERFGTGFERRFSPNAYVRRTLSALHPCRTSSMGGHVDKCDHCGHIRISYNSCRNHHCPKCQNIQREAWIENRKQDLIPVLYFHVVFTIPDKLNSLFLHHPVFMHHLFFRSAWETIALFCFIKLQAETGMVTVLHTWGQNLSFHPYVHCVIPGGGINHKNQWKGVNISGNGKVFLFKTKNVSSVFRGKLLAGIQKHLPQDKRFKRELYKIPWVVYAKEPFAGPEQVIEYLGW